MKQTYASEYCDIYEQHWWWRARERFLLGRFDRLLAGRQAGAILDVGCGDGLFFNKLKIYGQPEGIEPDRSLVSDRGLARGPIHIGPFDQTFQPGKAYFLITMLDVLEHVEDSIAFLKQGRELLKPDGYIIITVPAFPSLWTHHDTLNAHRRRYTRKGLTRVVTRSGLVIESLVYFFFWIAPVKLLIRLKETLFPPTAETVPVPAALLNRTLYTLCALEQELFRRIPPPFGSSLFAICRKKPGSVTF